MVNNPLKEYFLNLMKLNNLKNYRELSRFLNVTYGIIGNTMQNNTIFASRKLTEQLSKTLQRKPEDVLCDIYSPYFFQYCPDYLKIVTLSLYYHFKYKLYWENNIIIESHLVRLPYIEKQISIHAIMRREGLEAKYTLILDWSSINRALVDWCERTHNFLVKNGCILMAMSNLYYKICTDDFDDIKRMIVVFASDEEEDYQLFRKMCNDSKHRVLPLLYDDNAEYSIRDVDMLNG